MIRIAVVDDDMTSIDLVLSHLDRFQQEAGEPFHVGAFRDGSDILEAYRPDWDILLLDIQMARVDGMTAARRIREVDPEVIIVFITASPQYAISGYEVGALSYLLKPVSYPAFEQELRRSIRRLAQRERRYLLFATTDGSRHRVDLADIRYLESARHQVVIHTLDSHYSVVATMRAMEEELGPSDFLRCNSGTIVNLRHVTGMEGNDCIMRGGVRLPVSRARKRELLSALATYIGANGISP